MRRRERLRMHVFEQAARLFEENGGEHGGGFERTTVEAIAARSDISVRTFFRYFESKTDVIYLDLRRSLEDYLNFLHRRLKAGEDPLSAAMLARIEQVNAFVLKPSNEQRLRRAFNSTIFRQRHAVWLASWEHSISELLMPYLAPDPDAALRADLIACLSVRISSIAVERWAAKPPGEISLAACLEGSFATLLALASGRKLSVNPSAPNIPGSSASRARDGARRR